MEVTIKPGRVRGKITAPPSKSMAQRFLICGALAQGTSKIENIALSEDVAAAIRCLRALGAEIEVNGSVAEVRGGIAPRDGAVADCGASGAVLRFLIPAAIASGKEITFTGTPRLFERPLGVYEEICAGRGIEFVRGENSLTVKGKLPAGEYRIPGDVSSQFASGLLFALPLQEGESRIEFTTRIESKSYIDMTLYALRRFGISAGWEGERLIKIPGCEKLRPAKVLVPGDYSNAAFFAAMNCFGSEIEIAGLDPDSLQGDRAYEEFFPLLCAGRPSIDISACPDLAPVLFAVAAAKNGALFTGTRRLAYKESSRAAAMAEELAKFGARLEIGENFVAVSGGGLHPPEEKLDSHNDHRIAMALAVLCTAFGGTISGGEAVRKSCPNFFDTMKSLGFEAESGDII